MSTVRNADAADWVRLVVATLARVLLFSILGSLLWSAVPTLWGWKATTVMSDSMTPRIWSGDVVVTMPLAAAQIQLGHVVLVHNPARAGELLLHRYVGITSAGDFITRGDANGQNDSTPVPRDQVIGVAVVLTLVLGAGAHAAFAATTANPGDILTAAASYPCLTPSPANSPYLYYAYDESSGSSAVDSSANNRTGTLQSGVSRGSAGCAAFATFDGTSSGQVVTASTSVAAPASFSIAAWFKTTTAGGELLGFGNSASGASTAADRQLFLDNSGRVKFSVVPLLGITTITSPSSYLDGAWHLAVATMDGTLLTGTGMKLYVDGTQVAANANTIGALQLFGYWRIGYDNLGVLGGGAPTNSAFTGSMDDTAVYTTTVTAGQVAAMYSAGRL